MTNKKFDLSVLVTDDMTKRVRQTAREMREYEQEVEWHRQNDPDFEEWYNNECQKTQSELDEITVHMTFAEIDEMLRKQHEQETKSMS